MLWHTIAIKQIRIEKAFTFIQDVYFNFTYQILKCLIEHVKSHLAACISGLKMLNVFIYVFYSLHLYVALLILKNEL